MTSVTTLPTAGAVDIGTLDDFEPDSMKMVKVGGRRLVVVRTDDGLFALNQACPHEGYGLSTGELNCDHSAGAVITCAWHNWKFRVVDGACVQGEEDVVSHRVIVGDDGTVSVVLTEPDPEVMRPRLLESLRSAIEKDYMGQASRDIVRLLQADSNPGELIWEAVAYGAPRAEFGWGHAIASLTDCLTMSDGYDGDERALPIAQAIAGVAEGERGRPERPLPPPATDVSNDPGEARAAFRSAVEAERTVDAQAIIRAAIHRGDGPALLRPWFTDVVADHHLSYGHAAIYGQKAFELLDLLGWDRADTVLPHLVPTITYGTREDSLPYMKLFHRGIAAYNLGELAAAAGSPSAGWVDDGRLLAALLGPDRTEAARAACDELLAGAGLDRVLDAVTLASSERMLRYDTDGEFDALDDFGWLDITHGVTYSNAVRWHLDHAVDAPTVDHVRLVLWAAFLANWTGRHEWHTRVGERVEVEPLDGDLAIYGERLQDASLRDAMSRFIWVAHGIKTSLAATREAVHLGSDMPLTATHRFLFAPKRERGVAATVARSIDCVNKFDV